MKISKQNLKDISQLIFDGYLSTDVFFKDTYITIRTLKTDEQTTLFSRYKYLSKTNNFFLIVDLLSISIKSIGGIEINDEEKIRMKLLAIKSIFTIFLYNHYNKLESEINHLVKVIDFYIQSSESIFYWNLYKNSSQIIDFNSLKKINQFQYYWVVQNSMKDTLELDRKEWARVEYMTNSICAFVNPKAYRQSKSGKNVSDSIGQEFESKLDYRNDVLDRLEKSGKKEIEIEAEVDFFNQDQPVFNQLKKGEDETKEVYSDRINEMMIEQNQGKVVDDHDKQIRLYELNLFKKLLLEKRVKVEVARKIRERKKFLEVEDLNKISEDGIFKEEISIIGDDDSLEKLDSQAKEGGFYNNGVSYLEIINEKAFSSIPKEQREEAFKMVMEAEIDIDKATEIFLKNLYKEDKNKDKNESEEKQIQTSKVIIDKEGKRLKKDFNVDVGLKDEDFLEEEKTEEIKNAAAKAATLDITVNSGNDLVKAKNEKIEKFNSILDKRKMLKKRNDDLDEIIFQDK